MHTDKKYCVLQACTLISFLWPALVVSHCDLPFAGRGPGLESVSLAGCVKVTQKGIAALLKGSPAAQSLTSLDVSRCAGLSGNALDIPPKVCPA